MDFVGLDVQCPNCKRIMFKTTKDFDPNDKVHGGMVRSVTSYLIDWLMVRSTSSSEMTCPECLSPIVRDGVLNVRLPLRDVGDFFRDEENYRLRAEFLANIDQQVMLEQKRDEDEYNDRYLKALIEENKKLFKYVCTVCGKGFSNKTRYEDHMVKEH